MCTLAERLVACCTCPAAGTVHSNGFGHLMRLNGREGGSKLATGSQLMQAGHRVGVGDRWTCSGDRNSAAASVAIGTVRLATKPARQCGTCTRLLLLRWDTHQGLPLPAVPHSS